MKRSLVALVAALMSTLAIASAAAADVRPGVQTITDGSGQCTGNFIFSDGAEDLPRPVRALREHRREHRHERLHRPVAAARHARRGRGRVEPGLVPGRRHPRLQLVDHHEAARRDVNSETCRYNDFALIELPAGTATNPTVPFWGGPQGIGGTATPAATSISYGNSSLRFGIEVLKPKRGVTVTSTPGGWSHTVYTATPGIPGDSGSAFLNANGPGPRHAEHGRRGAVPGLQRGQRPRQGARVHEGQRRRFLGRLVNGSSNGKPRVRRSRRAAPSTSVVMARVPASHRGSRPSRRGGGPDA